MKDSETYYYVSEIEEINWDCCVQGNNYSNEEHKW